MGFDVRVVLPKRVQTVVVLSYAVSNQGPTIFELERKFSDLRSPDAWKMLFWNHLFHVKYKNKGSV